jgi:hypothetical protein
LKNKYFFCLFCILTAISLQGCAYYHVQEPLDINYENTSLGSKHGTANSWSVLWLFSWGDRGTRAAAKNGGITTITHADTEIKIVLFGLYMRFTTVVYGD